jgi:hypothetical protein
MQKKKGEGRRRRRRRKKRMTDWAWWFTPIIPALMR